MGKDKIPLKPLPKGITLPEIPEGWEWCSTQSHALVLYMPGGFGTQFVLWANFGDKDIEPHVYISPPDTEKCALRIDFRIGEGISSVDDGLHMMTTRALLGMFDKENDDG